LNHFEEAVGWLTEPGEESPASEHCLEVVPLVTNLLGITDPGDA
jgi:hypothetical protein